MSEVRVAIKPEAEIYPAVEIYQIGNPKPDEGFAIPAELWEKLCRAQEALDEAEPAILLHVAEYYPQSTAGQWIKDYR